MNAYKLETPDDEVAEQLASDLNQLGAVAVRQGIAVVMLVPDDLHNAAINIWCSCAYSSSLSQHDKALLGL